MLAQSLFLKAHPLCCSPRIPRGYMSSRDATRGQRRAAREVVIVFEKPLGVSFLKSSPPLLLSPHPTGVRVEQGCNAWAEASRGGGCDRFRKAPRSL
jgi:hypothetical protein